MCSTLTPPHLLSLHHPFAYDLIDRRLDETGSDLLRKLQERLAKLAGGVAVISVGASTESETKERKARVEDALHVSRAAVEEGVVAGGGVAYLRTQRRSIVLSWKVMRLLVRKSFRRALEFPTRQLANYAGQEGALIVQEVKKRSGNEGLNVAAGKYEDLVKAGVVDPTKVVSTALQNAASIAALMLTTEALVAEMSQKEKPAFGWCGRHGWYGLLSHTIPS
jgi:chaperonin GroEL